MFDLNKIIRPNILKLKPYSCARDEFKGVANVSLDANESPYNKPFNRYPDPLQLKLKKKIAAKKNINVENIFLGNGSDEAIDLTFRAFCNPSEDNVVAIAPTYGMYSVCAAINNVEYREVELDNEFKLNADKLLKATDSKTKVIWLCSPNNPTGNSLDADEIIKIVESFDGIVVIDEAYIDFSSNESFLSKLKTYPNLIILQTLSKAWGCAGLRLGLAFASAEIIATLNKIKYPYNINILTQNVAETVIDYAPKDSWVQSILNEREKMIAEIKRLPVVKHIYPTDANFILVKVENADKIYQQLASCGIIVRNRNTVKLCGDCLRITIGSPAENTILVNHLRLSAL